MNRAMKTLSLKAGDIQRKWYLIDMQDMVVGRVAAIIAKILRGKNESVLTPHLDHGACVVLINAEKAHFTGKKMSDKIYYRHTGYPGGIKQRIAGQVLEGRYPERVMELAVGRMMGTRGPLSRQRMKNLYIYAGLQHPHQAQSPVILDVRSWNIKNSKRSLG